MNFSNLIGNKKIKENLINVINSKKISHAYIFLGISGIGKSLLAKAFATSILCENFQNDLCGTCKSCKLSNSNAHPDIKVLNLALDDDGKEKNSISVDSIREFKSEVYLKPFFSHRKIYILENAHKMTVEAQNSLLKIFEEPPSYITIILICENLSKILPTISSRAVTFKFSPLSSGELAEYIKVNCPEIENKEVLSKISDGSIEKLNNIWQDEDNLVFRTEILNGVSNLFTIRNRTAVNHLFSVFMKNKEKKFEIINIIISVLIDISRKKTNTDITNVDIADLIYKMKNEITFMAIEQSISVLIDLSEKLSKNSNYKLAVMDALYSIWEVAYD